ncbi:condensin complex protein MksE [Polaromonas naphthalenivorans]|uniref:Uncharacterized protein n=1 Tax=Polaromonas naphthalenivorans (strain CJ2) TaxID=365044 RepID=A1VVP1_POLNA|nr:hypothetical protein [Polaromonas naphthalenivorans]ABM39719.1 conserved hypothetical protein [Polaromonas naphthalenivorans CJ2]
MTAPLYLHKLPLLGDLFAFLNSGKHLNRMAEPQLWAELEREQDAYQRLFVSLGSALRIDARGFAWFHVDDASSNVSKTTRQLALLFMLIFEFQADLGLHLGRFTDWLVDGALLDALLEKNRLLLEAEGLGEREQLEPLLRTASNYGFATSEGSSGWRILPAVFRYLDRFEALTRTASQNEEVIPQPPATKEVA